MLTSRRAQQHSSSRSIEVHAGCLNGVHACPPKLRQSLVPVLRTCSTPGKNSYAYVVTYVATSSARGATRFEDAAIRHA